MKNIYPEGFQGTCDHCDLYEIQKLQDILLETVAEATLAASNKPFNGITLNEYKRKLIECLDLKSNNKSPGNIILISIIKL